MVARTLADTPVTSLYLWFDSGSVHDPAGGEGLSHFLEHLVFKGTARRGVGACAAEIEGLGGDLNAYTGYEQTVLHATVQAGAWAEALDVLLDMARSSTFDAAELEREKAVVAEEIRAAQDDPDAVLGDAVANALFPGHPYGRPILGQADRVTGLDRATIVDHWRRAYSPGRAIVAVAGPQPPEEVLETVRVHTRGWSDGQPLADPAEPSPARPAAITPGKRFDTTTVEIAWRGPAIGHADLPALDVLVACLTQGEASLLVRELQRERELASDFWANQAPRRQAGMIQLGFLPREATTADAVRGALTAIHTWARRGPDPRLVARSRRGLLADLLFADETTDGVAHDLCWYTARAGGPEAREAYVAALGAVTDADVHRVARTWLEPSNAVIGAVDRHLKTARLEKCRPERHRVSVAPGPGPWRLDNGVRLSVLRDERPIAAIRVVAPGGWLADERPGVSQAWARTVTCGGGGLDTDAMAEAIDELAATLSGSAGPNTAGLHATAPADTLPGLLDLVGTVTCTPHLDPHDWERVRDEIREELDTLSDRPSALAEIEMLARLFPGHPWGFGGVGTLSSIGRLSARQLQQWHDRLFAGGNLDVVVVGNVDRERVRESVASWTPPKGKGLGKRPAPGPVDTEPVEIRAGHHQAWLVIGLRSTSVFDPARRAVDMASAILGGQGGRLFLDLRERMGLAYDVWCTATPGVDGGWMSAGLATDPSRLGEARTALRACVTSLAERGPSEDELARNRRMVLGQRAMSLQRCSDRANAAALGQCLGLPWDMGSLESELAAVSAGDVRDALQSAFAGGVVEVAVLPDA